jgi:enterochelin esterase family protein
MRTILQARGYPVHYTEFNGAHNPISWQATLPYGLLAMLGKGMTT